MRLILASTSPRRRELLALLQLPFEVRAPAFSEELRRDLPAAEQACLFAEGKARACLNEADALIIGCDTLIALDHDIVGKPTDAEDAVRMLTRLSGRAHDIFTGVAVIDSTSGRSRSKVESVRVVFKPIPAETIRDYVASGESLDKAGAYAIQGAGAAFIQSIEGDFTAAVGLPLRLLAELLGAMGWSIAVDHVYRDRPYPNWARFS